jgi:uncharacterized delta-60 repeat protein
MVSFRALVLTFCVSLLAPASALAGPGDLDPSFSDDGWATASLGQYDHAFGVAIDSHGRIVAVGTSHQDRPSAYDFAVARFTPGGQLDPTFSGDGRTKVSFGHNDEAYAVAVDSQDRIVVAGSADDGDNTNVFGVARLNPDGSPDTSFSANGKVKTRIGDDASSAWSVAIDPQGRIVAAGDAAVPIYGDDFALARYEPDGSLDPSFGLHGKVRTNFYRRSFDDARAVAIDSRGRIVAAGTARDGDVFALARYRPNGDLDAAFSDNGRVVTPLGYGAATSVAIDAQDRPVAAGRLDDPDSGFGVMRYRANGTLDPSFSGDGIAHTVFNGQIDGAGAVAIDPFGRIVAAGTTYAGPPTGSDVALARYDASGDLDPTFSGDGTVQSQMSGEQIARAAALDPRGKIVVAGSATINGNFLVGRYFGGPDLP